MDIGNILAELKRVMKGRGVSYKDIANQLELSESGVKKLLSNENISIARLNDILKVVGISLVDLINLGERVGGQPYTMTPEQESIFLEDGNLFNFIFHIYKGNGDLEVLKKSFPRISMVRIEQLIAKLESVGLARRNENKIESPLLDCFTMTPELNRLFHNRVKTNIDKQMAKLIDESVGSSRKYIYQSISEMTLTESSKLELELALKKVFEEFLERSKREKALNSRDKLTECVLSIDALPMKLSELHPFE